MIAVFEVVLTEDSRLATLPGSASTARAYQPSFPAPRDADDADALALWINAHQLFFLLLCAGTSAADRANAALAEGRGHDAITAIGAITALRRAATALTDVAGGISPDRYTACIRPTMAAMRSDFSGVSSRDNWRFDDAMRDLTATVVRALGEAPPGPDRDALATAWREQEAATRAWWELHALVMRRLVPDPTSLARLAYDKLVAEGLRGSFRDFQKVLRSPEALDTNDTFFAVRRGGATSATQHAALERLQRWLDGRLDPSARGVIERGVAAARALLGEVLRPTSARSG